MVPADSPLPETALTVDIRQLPWIRPLAADYAFHFDRVAAFFAGDPSTPEAWRDTIARSQATARQPETLSRALVAQLTRRQAPPQALAAAHRLAQSDTRVIITGQQAGLFGGPLFTLLKALTAMKLAADVEAAHGVPVVPVFWIDAEDHDWPEVSGTTVLDAEMAAISVKAAAVAGAGQEPIARLRFDDSLGDTIEHLAAALPVTEFTAPTLEALRRAYAPGHGVAESFGRWLDAVLGPHGLVVYDSSDPATKPLAAQVFTRECREPGATAALATLAGDALKAAGYHAQVTPQEGAVALFHLGHGRQAIRMQGDTVTVGDRTLTHQQLLDECQTHPEQFSPNVLLRPIVQDTIFPTICYVAGPNELAYLGQLRGIYERFGVAMPLMYQRATATLVDSASLRFIRKHDLPLTAFQAQDERSLNALLEAQLPPTVEAALTSAAARISDELDQLMGVVPQIDVTLEGTVRTTQGRLQHEMHTLHTKVIQAAKRKDETLRRQFQRTRALTFPLGHSQEREIGLVWFVNRYGDALVPRLLERLPLTMGQHHVLSL
jgi:bacillithiol biosynthesis cysteine-adding enzyme BshC